MCKRILPFLLAAVLMTGCAAETFSAAVETMAPTETAAVTEPTQPETTPVTEPADAAERILSKMNLREKVGQLFMIRPDSLDETLSQAEIADANAKGITELTAAMTKKLADYPVGGIVMFSKNITSPTQITAFIDALQNASSIPLFLSVDEEGGTVARLANHRAFDLPKYKNAASIGAETAALEMGSTIGKYLNDYGFNMDFAPVADVNTNPSNPIIGTRAFSADAATAGKLARAMADGLAQQGIIAVFKHFPGHGDTAEDSHSGIAITRKTAEEMAACEWIPFKKAGSEDCIMTGHIAAPQITGDTTPATMSRKLVTEILKEQLGFSGLVITDSLEMAAITDAYSPGDAALAALDAGCDILLMPNGMEEAFDAVVTAVENGTLPEERLNSIVKRILRFKQARGLLFHPGVG